MATTTSAAVRMPGALVRSITLAGLLIGAIGGLDQAVFFTVAENKYPTFIFQYIASAVLGQAAFTGGFATALLGLLIHFGIAFVVAAVFILAAAQLAFLRRAAILSGLLYAVAVVLVMNILIVPLSLAPKLTATLPLALNTLIGSILYIGLPCGLFVRRMVKDK